MTELLPGTEFLLGPMVPYCLLLIGLALVLFYPELKKIHEEH